MTGPDATGPGFEPVQIEVAGGHVLTVRAMADEDAPAIKDLYEQLSVGDTYRRFFSAFSATEAFVHTWVHRCRRHGFGLVAVVDDGAPTAELIAEAGYVVVPDGDGEFAITVAQGHRGWLGPYLLDLLVEAAAARGVLNLEADILTENRTMLALVRRRGFVTDADTDFSVVHVTIGTSPGGPVWPPVARGPRLLVEQPGARWSGRRRAVGAGFDVVACGNVDHCPVRQGGSCPLADGADIIVVAFPPDDPRGTELVEAHGRRDHVRPVVVAAPAPSSERRPPDQQQCHLASGSPSAALLAKLEQVVGDL